VRSIGFDLFRWAVGLIEVGVAILLLIVPSQLLSPTYTYIRPHAGLYGILLLIAGGQLVILAATRPVADRRPAFVPHALSSIPLFYLAYGYYVAGGASAVVIDGALGLGCLVGPLLVRQSDSPTPSVAGDIVFYVIALSEVVDGALMLLFPAWFPTALYGVFTAYLDVFGGVFLIGGILLFVAHAFPKTPYWSLGVAHVVAALALVAMLLEGLMAQSAWAELVHYFVLDVFLLVSPFFYGPPGLLRSDTLAVRLSALIALIAAVPLIYLSIATSTSVRGVFQDLVSANQLVLAKVSANRLMDLLATSQREIDVLGDFEGIRTMEPSTQREVLVTASGALPQFTALTTCDMDGYEIARSDDRPLAFVGDLYAYQTARSGHVTWQYLMSRSLREPVIVFAAPIRRSDERVAGVLLGTIRMSGLADIIDESALENGSRVLLLDDRGEVVAQSGSQVPDATQPIPNLPRSEGVASFALLGQPYLAGVATIKPQGWRVVVAIPETIALTTIDRVQKVTLLTFVVALVGVLLAAGAVARLLVRPITQLTLAAEALARGDDRAPLPVRAGGEVGVLASSFDSMRSTLRAQAAALVARERRARGVASVVVAVEHSHGFDGALTALCRELRVVLDCALCVIYLEDRNAFVARAVNSVDDSLAKRCETIVSTDDDSLVCHVFRTGVPSLVNDVGAERRLDRRTVQSLGIEAVIAVPVTVGGKRRGVLMAVDTERSDRFATSELELARAAVDTVDLVLENARLDEENDRRRIEAERLAAVNAELYAAERAAADALRESQAEMERFVYTVSHDLRAPLVTIQGFTHRVLQNYGARLDDRGRDYLERVEKNAQRLEFLINDILQLSRIGRTDVDVQAVRLQELAEEVRGQLAVQLEAKGITFVIPEDLPTVLANRYRLGQVLENLVENAILYIGNPPRSSKPTISVGAREITDGWQIWVADNGVGIPPEHRERVFRVFERLSAGKAAHPDGTGIGLATVRKIVENHGGRVWVEETPGGGATIVFTIVRNGSPTQMIGGRNVAPMSVERVSGS
jgi:signal transduction histidine kinase/HAMP domain-containing protein